MKKILYSVMALAIAAMTFTACEDVPEPYPTPTPSNGSSTVEGAEGDGSLENPFNAIAANNVAKELGSGNVSEQMYYIKGKVVSIATDKNGNVLNFDQGTYGNASFYISDDGTSTNQFYCYRVLYLGNKKWTQGAGEILKEGDEVIVCAKITMYNTTPETQQNEGFLYSLNGKSEGGGGGETQGTPSGSGTQADPYNVAKALQVCTEVGETGAANEVYAKGIVTSITEISTQFGNGTFIISDDAAGSNKLTVYRAYSLGNEKFKAENEIKVGDEVVIYGKLVNFRGNTPEFTQGCYIYSLNGKTEGSGGGGDTPATEAKAVTIADFNAAAESTDVWYQLTGTVKNLKDGDQYGNFDLEDATGSVYVYGLLSEKGGEKKKFQDLVAAKGIKNGSKITIIGTRGSYNDKIEVMNAYFVSIEGGGGGDTPTPQPDGDLGSADSPITVAKALEIINGYEAAGESATDAYVKGKIVSVQSFNEKYKSITYYISDDGTESNQLQVYSGKGLNGADFSSSDDLKSGAVVVVKGKLKKYVKGESITPEINQNSQIVSIDGNTGGGGGDTPGGGGGEVSGASISIAAADFGFEDKGAATQKTLSDGTKIVFDKGEGSTAPAYYGGSYASVRIYAKNTITITASKKIVKITIETTDPQGSTKYNGNDMAYAEGGSKVSIKKESDTKVSFSGLNDSTVKIVNDHTEGKGGTQLRIKTLTITYAE